MSREASLAKKKSRLSDILSHSDVWKWLPSLQHRADTGLSGIQVTISGRRLQTCALAKDPCRNGSRRDGVDSDAPLPQLYRGASSQMIDTGLRNGIVDTAEPSPASVDTRPFLYDAGGPTPSACEPLPQAGPRLL
jgi:hypothetical protein